MTSVELETLVIRPFVVRIFSFQCTMLLFAIIEVLFAQERCLYLFHRGEKCSIFLWSNQCARPQKKPRKKSSNFGRVRKRGKQRWNIDIKSSCKYGQSKLDYWLSDHRQWKVMPMHQLLDSLNDAKWCPGQPPCNPPSALGMRRGDCGTTGINRKCSITHLFFSVFHEPIYTIIFETWAFFSVRF